MTVDLDVARAFGEALALGLLVGLERYRSRDEGETRIAGIRTFPIYALLGAIGGLLGLPVALVIFGVLSVFLVAGYWRESARSLGMTTEAAAMATYWLGVLVHTHETLAVATAIVLVMLLAHKQALHAFARRGLSEVELFDTLKFLAVVFVVYPLLPEGYLTRWELVQPRRVWLLVILVSTLDYAGYIATRVLGGRRGIALTALVGGIASTTAVTASLADRSREAPDASRLLGVIGVMANAVQAPRLLLLVLAVDAGLAARLAAPLTAMTVLGFAGAWLLSRRGRPRDEPQVDLPLSNPYAFLPALKFALFFSVVLAAAQVGTRVLGQGAVVALAAVSGLVDCSAISLSLAEMTADRALPLTVAAASVVLAVASNAVFKLGIALLQGTRAFAFWLGGGLVTMVLGAAAALAVQVHLLP